MFRRWFGASQTDRHYARGLEFFHRGELRASVEAFHESLEESAGPNHPTTALASFYKAEAHARLGRAALADGRWADAHAEFESAMEIQPGFPDLHFCLGLASFQEGRTHDALRSARSALEFNRRYLEAEALVYLCHRELSEQLLAEQCLQNCAELAAQRSEPVARLFCDGQQFSADQLLELLLDGLRRRERIEHATSLLEQGFWEEARTGFARLVEEHPKYPDLRIKLAKCHYGLGVADAAMAELTVALELRPGLVQANILMGVLELARHEIARAKLCFEKAMQGDPRSTFARYGLASAAILLDAPHVARPLAESLAREHPDSVATLRLLCVCRSLTRDAEGAMEILPRWMMLSGEDNEATLDQIALALEHDRVDLAERLVRKLPDGAADPATALARARVAARAGDREGAQSLLELGRERLGAPICLTVEAAALALEAGDAQSAVQLLDPLGSRADYPRLLLARALRMSGRGRESARLLGDTPCLSLDGQVELLLARREVGDAAQAESEFAELMEFAPLEARIRAHDPERWCEPFRTVAHAVEAAH